MAALLVPVDEERGARGAVPMPPFPCPRSHAALRRAPATDREGRRNDERVGQARPGPFSPPLTMTGPDMGPAADATVDRQTAGPRRAPTPRLPRSAQESGPREWPKR